MVFIGLGIRQNQVRVERGIIMSKERKIDNVKFRPIDVILFIFMLLCAFYF